MFFPPPYGGVPQWVGHEFFGTDLGKVPGAPGPIVLEVANLRIHRKGSFCVWKDSMWQVVVYGQNFFRVVKALDIG